MPMARVEMGHSAPAAARRYVRPPGCLGAGDERTSKETVMRWTSIFTVALLPGILLATTAGAEMTADAIKQEIIDRCHASMGNYGTRMVKACVDQDIKAANALGEYPDSAIDIMKRCATIMGRYGWHMVKACVDQDLAAEAALSK